MPSGCAAPFDPDPFSTSQAAVALANWGSPPHLRRSRRRRTNRSAPSRELPLSSEPHRFVDPERDSCRLRRAFWLAAGFAALLWVIKLTELVLGLNLVAYAVYPGHWDSLAGILLAPLLHGSVSHLLANTAPILVLGTALLCGYPKAARIVLPVVFLGSGIAVWLFARPAFHLGASGLTFGLMFFVFTMGVLRWERRAIALALMVFLLYGGMIWGIFPTASDISFEYHLAGAVLGVLLAVLLKRLDPAPPEKRYSWEGEDEGQDDWPFESAGGGEQEIGGRDSRVPPCPT